MTDSFKTVAIIPARGGSKGLPRKNALALNGKPLLAYSIETALKARLVDNVIVSTEDEELAEIAIAAGAEVPFKRTQKLAEDNAPPGWAVDWTLARLREEGRVWDGVMTLYPTHPFRKPGMLDWAASCLRDGYSSVITVKKIIQDRFNLCRRKESGRVLPLLDRDGACPYFRPFGTLHAQAFSTNTDTVMIPLTDPIELIDIDSKADFDLAREVVLQSLYDFNGDFTSLKDVQ